MAVVCRDHRNRMLSLTIIRLFPEGGSICVFDRVAVAML